jgi:DNA mismatch repair protein MutL
MMIHILPEEVVSKIAAGEVVERPASVVKELLENAIDAKASEIRIKVEEAGRRLIEVSDDGCGIPSLEIKLALRRHATSKIERSEQLFQIKTLGFRGEALASIAAVSHFSILTKTDNSSIGTQLDVDGGVERSVRQVALHQGTTVKVNDLFYNLPARLKFLKTDQTERLVIENLVSRYALAYPAVRFVLTFNDKIGFQTLGNDNQREILSQIYGVEIGKQLQEIEWEEEQARVSGFVSPISLTRSNRKEITIFVNGRWVQDISISTAFIQAYHSLLMIGRFPIGALFIEVNPEDVDVNVHPAKAEVRFRQPDRIFSLVQHAVKRKILLNPTSIPIETGGWFQQPRYEGENQLQTKGFLFQKPIGKEEFQKENPSLSTSESGEPIHSDLPLLRVIGQIGLTYIVAEGPDGLYLIDQHSAHERVLFEKMMDRKSSNDSQALLSPANIEVASQLIEVLALQIPLLKKLGFELEHFGGNTFRVRAIPSIFIKNDPVSLVNSVLDNVTEDETPLANEIEKKVIARICKRAAIKSGQVLSLEEQKGLVNELERCVSPRTCPHGRPTMIHLSVNLLEKQFGRRGSI